VTTHLTSGYTYPKELRDRPTRETRPERAIAACNDQHEPDQVSVYDNPEDEHLIDCPGCLDWLAEGDNRLRVTPGGIQEWIRNHVAAGDADLYVTGVPSGETHRVTEADLEGWD
jgi:hypothetical protein